METGNLQKKFILLQINDSLFPIGGYSHSYGLETYIQKGIVQDEKSAENFIQHYITQTLVYTELLIIRFAYEYAQKKDMNQIMELEELVEASKIPMEIREASKKLGSRFIKTLTPLNLTYENEIFHNYVRECAGRCVSHPCAYGVFCASAGIELLSSLEHYLYAQTSAMVTNCVKAVPLSQTSGQKILADTYPLFQLVLDRVNQAGKDMLCASTPGFDIRCMQHEGLYSRIYMS